MDVTLDQARAFEAVARLGTVQRAAQSLNKGHSAILYLLKNLEEQVQLPLFDRSGYRNQLTSEGELVLDHCRSLLDVHEKLESLTQKLKGGWEARLKIIYDGVIDFQDIATAMAKVHRADSPTQFQLQAAYLNEVDARFQEQRADIMVTILPIRQVQFATEELKPIELKLVAHKGHPLVQKGRKKIKYEDLQKETYIRVQTQSRPLGLSTEIFDMPSHFVVNDFHSKKLAIAHKLGFGWMPSYLIEKELKKGDWVVLPTEIENKHTLFPKLYFRNKESIGRAARNLIQNLREGS